jgi:hypothetical protein
MLDGEVVEAVRAGKFAVHAVSNIPEGIEILTGVPAGARAQGGRFLEGSIYDRADRRLDEIARKIREFGPSAPERI